MRAVILLLCATLAACGSEPDFQERYDDTQAEIEARAQALDADLKEEAEE